MNKWHISRRTMLRGVGAAVALPYLDVMQPTSVSASQTSGPTVRACYLYIPNGVANDAWGPDRVGPDGKLLRLNRWMSPFEPFKRDILLPRNVWTPRGNGHGAGTATWLTGYGYDSRNIDAGGPSVDQIAARAIGSQTLLPSMELSTKGEGFFSNSLVRNTISWADDTTPIPRDTEPRVLFDRMFRAGNSELSDQSVLDSVLDDARSMRRRVSNADVRKIDEYLESIRALERRIDFAETQSRRAAQDRLLSNALQRPAAEIPEDHQAYVRAMLDIVALAFWSDATRVCTFMLDHGQSNRYFNFIDGVQGTWHALSHWQDASGKTEDDDGITSWESPEQKRRMYNAVTKWHNVQVAYLLDRLKKIREPDGGSLLDNSVVLYGSSLADGHMHAEENLPLMLAGRAGGTIDTGRQLNFNEPTSMSHLHLAILQRMGIRVDQFAESDTPMSLTT